MLSINPTTTLFFSLLISQQLRSILLLRMLSQIHFRQNLLPSCLFFWVHSYISSGGFVRLLSSTHLLVCQDLVLFMLILLTGVLCPFAQVLFILSSFCLPFQPECCSNLFFLETLPYRSAFNFVLLRCILSFNLFKLFKVLWVHSLVKEAT